MKIKRAQTNNQTNKQKKKKKKKKKVLQGGLEPPTFGS